MKREFLIFSIFFIACGKYSPPISPDYFKISEFAFLEVWTDVQNVYISVKLPVYQLNNKEVYNVDAAKCHYSNKEYELVEDAKVSKTRDDNLMIVCTPPKNFIGDLRISLGHLGLSGFVSKKAIKVYNKDKLEAYLP